MGWLMDHILSWITDRIVDTFTGLFSTIQQMLVSTPDVTRLPQIQQLTAHTTQVLDIVFGLAFTAAGALTIFAGADERSRYTAKILLPRIVFAFLVAHFSPLFCGQIITLVDAVTTALAGTAPNHAGALSSVATALHTAQNRGMTALLFAVLAAMATFLLAAVTFSSLTRIGLLVVIAVAGPLALACHALPPLEPVARLWWRTLVGCLTVPLLQALALQAGQMILLDPHAQGFLFGVPSSAMLNLMLVIALLWICVKIPALVRQYVTHSSGSRVGSYVVRVLLVQRGLRVLRGTK